MRKSVGGMMMIRLALLLVPALSQASWEGQEVVLRQHLEGAQARAVAPQTPVVQGDSAIPAVLPPGSQAGETAADSTALTPKVPAKEKRGESKALLILTELGMGAVALSLWAGIAAVGWAVAASNTVGLGVVVGISILVGLGVLGILLFIALGVR